VYSLFVVVRKILFESFPKGLQTMSYMIETLFLDCSIEAFYMSLVIGSSDSRMAMSYSIPSQSMGKPNGEL
jgi:hypothetical protein